MQSRGQDHLQSAKIAHDWYENDMQEYRSKKRGYRWSAFGGGLVSAMGFYCIGMPELVPAAILFIISGGCYCCFYLNKIDKLSPPRKPGFGIPPHIMARDRSNLSPPHLSVSDGHFKCANLEVAVCQHLNISKDAITHKDLASITSFEASYYDIVNISGLEYATGLSSLTLDENLITDITPLAELANLTELNIYGNQLADITPLAGLINLTELRLDGNQLTDITPLAELTNLTSLDLSHNQIADIMPLAKLTNLTSLVLGYNPFTDIMPLARLTNLTELSLSRKKLPGYKMHLIRQALPNCIITPILP